MTDCSGWQEKREQLSTADDKTTAFRFFNGDGDGVGGLTIDYYAGYYVFSWYSAGIYQHKDMILKAFKVAIPDFKGIYEKCRYPQSALQKPILLKGTKLKSLWSF
ncbi:MAG: hypothetical protein U5K84_03270 [Alkalibacterium sp.]|nr:hypothetical protein [Alkalibacterium sp.]